MLIIGPSYDHRFCGHEYEKLRDMASAALAYKCMEVAYMRVVYSSQSDANRYRNELQTALQIFPPGNLDKLSGKSTCHMLVLL